MIPYSILNLIYQMWKYILLISKIILRTIFFSIKFFILWLFYAEFFDKIQDAISQGVLKMILFIQFQRFTFDVCFVMFTLCKPSLRFYGPRLIHLAIQLLRRIKNIILTLFRKSKYMRKISWDCSNYTVVLTSWYKRVQTTTIHYNESNI